MVESPAPSVPRNSEVITDHSQLVQMCADKMNPFLNSGQPVPLRRRQGGNDAWRAKWEGFVFGISDENEVMQRGVRISLDHGVYNTSTGLKKGLWEIRFCSDPELTVEQALKRALEEGGNVIEKYAEGREPNINQPNIVHLLADGTAFLYEYRFVERGIPTKKVHNSGKEIRGFGSPLSQELSAKLAEEIASFGVIK